MFPQDRGAGAKRPRESPLAGLSLGLEMLREPIRADLNSVALHYELPKKLAAVRA
jgi:hypothetical protein